MSFLAGFMSGLSGGSAIAVAASQPATPKPNGTQAKVSKVALPTLSVAGAVEHAISAMADAESGNMISAGVETVLFAQEASETILDTLDAFVESRTEAVAGGYTYWEGNSFGG